MFFSLDRFLCRKLPKEILLILGSLPGQAARPPPTRVSSFFHSFSASIFRPRFYLVFMDLGSHVGSIFSQFAIILQTFFRHRFRIAFSLSVDRRVDRRILGDTYSTACSMWFRHIQPFPKTCFFLHVLSILA